MAMNAHQGRSMLKPSINIAGTCKLKRSQMLQVKCSAKGGQIQVDAAGVTLNHAMHCGMDAIQPQCGKYA